MTLFSVTFFHLFPWTTFIIFCLIYIFLNFNIFLCGTCRSTEVQRQVTSVSYVHKINYWKDENELVQLDNTLIHAYSFFHLSPRIVFSIDFFLKSYGWGFTTRLIIAQTLHSLTGAAFTVLQLQYTMCLHEQIGRASAPLKLLSQKAGHSELLYSLKLLNPMNSFHPLPTILITKPQQVSCPCAWIQHIYSFRGK